VPYDTEKKVKAFEFAREEKPERTIEAFGFAFAG
jgi:hypothetical protein